VSTGAGLLTTLIAKKVLRSVYRAVRKEDPAAAFDSSRARSSWPEAMGWATAAGMGLVVAKIAGDRVAAFGWELATGTTPPGDEEPSGS
jgi:hypothetical protein